ncbi:MAG: gliding motility-associated C-terminal domain-containing protein, partial [Bacteroidales bacterium]
MQKKDIIFRKLIAENPYKKDFGKAEIHLNKIFLFLSLCLFTILFILSENSIAQTRLKGKKAGKPTWITSDPFKTDVFIENFGQFDNWATTDGKIKYAIDKADKIFFTPHGYTIRVDKIVKKEDDDLDETDSVKGSDAKNYEKDDDENRVLEKYTIHVNWMGSNPDPEIIASEPSSNYYTFGEKGYENVKAKGYKKIIYKNLYPQIDIEYTIPEKGGIKYKLILHPGADISQVKMQYTGDVENAIKDFEGNILVNTPAGAIVDHTPQSYYMENHDIIPSAFVLKDNVVSFKLNEPSISPVGEQIPEHRFQTVIIDPWTTTPTSLTTNNTAFDIDFDNFGNVYVSGGSNPYKLSKYSIAGSLLWTFTNPAGWSSTSQNAYSKFCLLHNSGTSFIGEGYTGLPAGARIMKIDNAGNLQFTSPYFGTNDEIWRMFYNNCNKKLIAFGGGTSTTDNIKIIADTNLSGSSSANFNGAICTYCNDVASVVMDDNGDFYALLTSLSQCLIVEGILAKSLFSSGYTPPCAFSVNSGYQFGEGNNFGIPGLNPSTNVTVRANALALNNNYIFGYDGKTLNAWNKTSGALLGSAVVNAGYGSGENRTHEGIAVDDCSNVYVGGTNQVHVFAFNGSVFTAAASITTNIPNEVYDIQLDKGTGILYVAGLGFVTVVPASVTCNVNQLILNISQTPGFCNGSATVTASGGTMPYTYLWSNGSTTSSITSVPAGWYYVTVMDNSCIKLKGTDSVLITSSFPTSICNDTSVCNGSSVPLWATGGATYTWAPAGSLSNANIANPVAHPASTTTYYVTISNGTCNILDSVKVTISPGPSVTVTNGSICNGQQDTLFAGGAASYLWSTGSTNTYIVESPASTTPYTVTGTTAGCSAAVTGTITVNPLPNAQITPFAPATCGLNNGSATATGGTTYLWSSGQTTATITHLAPGTYSVTVTSAAGCSSTTSVIINNIPGGTVTATSTDENCGHANGTASSTPVGGTPPYTYLWSNGHTTQNITNLPAGTYTVTVTDASSCTAVTSVTLTNIAGPSLQVLGSVNETCSYGNGSATVNAINGVLPYSYLWSNGNTSATATNLHAGTYTCTVTDSNHCTAINTVTITNTPGPTITISGINSANCGMSNGSATLNISGGTPAYTPIIWSNGETSQNILNVPTGTYCVTVTDANSCTTSACVTIPQKPGPVATHSYTDEICQMKNGTATAVPSGGVPPYIFSWSNGAITQTATGLSQGNYTYTVTDQGGCSTSGTVSIGEIPGPTAYFMYTPKILTILEGPVYFWDESTGGTRPYTYQWDFGDASSGTGTYNVHPYPNLGTYVISEIVTDSNRCKDTISDTVRVVDIFTFYTPNAFTPNNDGLNDNWAPQGTNIDTNNYNEYIYDRWGNLVFQTTKWQVSKTEPPKGQAEGWNGTIYNNGNNKDIVMDIYVYKIDLREFNHGPKHEYV